jgi:hypothetical protein
MSEEMARHLPPRAKVCKGSFQLKGIRESQLLFQLNPWAENLNFPEKKSS